MQDVLVFYKKSHNTDQNLIFLRDRSVFPVNVLYPLFHMLHDSVVIVFR